MVIPRLAATVKILVNGISVGIICISFVTIEGFRMNIFQEKSIEHKEAAAR